MTARDVRAPGESASTDGRTLRTQWLRGPDALRGLEDQWRALGGDPFASPDWILPWLEAFAADSEPEALAAWRDDELVGLLPLCRRGRRLRLPVNVHTPFFDVPARDWPAREALLAELLADRCTAIVLDGLPEASRTVSWLLEHRDGRRVTVRSRHVSPWVDTTVAVEAFRAATRHRWGAPLDRFRRKMIREHEASFALLQAPEDLDRILSEGFAVEASGWKGQAGTAITSDPRIEAFYRSVAHRFAARGQLALSWVSFGAEMVSFDLDLLAGDRLYLLKTGFDERHRRLAPGLVLRLALIERCIEAGLTAHELLGDDSPWKRKFASEARRHVELRLYRRAPPATAEWIYWRQLRPVLRRAYRTARSARARRSRPGLRRSPAPSTPST